MSCPTFKVSVGIPVFGLGFTSSNQLIVGGGGGPGRSGVKNKLSSFKIDARRKDLEEDAVFQFGADEDAPMCLDIHPQQDIVIAGVNGSEENIKAGNNENCRMFKVTEDSIEKVNSLKTVSSTNVEDYQRVVRFSQDGSLFAVGTTTGKVDVFKYPSLKSICDEPISVVTDDEVLDVDINLEKEKMVSTTRDSLKLINLRGKNVGHIVQTISSATAVKNNKVNFRAFRYGRGFSKAAGYAVANGITKPGGYIIQYDAYTLEPVKAVQVTKKQITAFCISQDGSVLGFASSDLSISLLNAGNLKVLTKIKDAHSFSITSIAVSPDRRIVASASADNTCRIVLLPLQFSNVTSINPLHTLLLAIVVAAILLWITSVVDLEPYFRPSTTGVDVKTTGSLDTVSSTIAMSETTFADVSPINSDHDVSPVNSDHDVSPIEALTKDEL